jgi:ribosome-associated translation inhibitor RaiA
MSDTVEYYSVRDYLKSSTSKKDRVAKIDQIIDALEDQLLLGAEAADIEEYMVDSGQTKIKTIYRSPKAITDALDALERQRNRVVNKGRRKKQARDQNNFIR